MVNRMKKSEKIKGIIVEINGQFVKFKSRTVLLNTSGHIMQGELLAPARLETCAGQSLFFKKTVKFNARQLVTKGTLTKTQRIIYKNKSVRLSGFQQFYEHGVIPKLEKKDATKHLKIHKTLLTIKDKKAREEMLELFTIANNNLIAHPHKIMYPMPSKTVSKR